jgi:lactate permease
MVVIAVFLYRIPPSGSSWPQNYDPTGHWWLSATAAALPIVVLLGSVAGLRMKAHSAALWGLATGVVIAVGVFHMPGKTAAMAIIYGAAYGLFPSSWIILNVIFMYQLTTEAGQFKTLQESLTSITQDRRLQLVLIAFAFGAFFEGAAGFGTPVAVTAALLIGLGFPPLKASGLSLIANTAPVAFGALGLPLVVLQGVTGLDLRVLSATVGRILTPFCILVPFWMVWAFAGFWNMLEVWPALLIAGGSFAIVQLVVSNLHGPWLVDIVAAPTTMVLLIVFLLRWHPKQVMTLGTEQDQAPRGSHGHATEKVIKAWLPWMILSAAVFLWGLPTMKGLLDKMLLDTFPVPGLHQMVQRVPPVVVTPTTEAAIYMGNWLSATGTGILLAALISGFIMGMSPRLMMKIYWSTIVRIRYSVLTIAAMLGLGFLTRYSGLDATMGLAFARTGVLYPFFGTLLGWLGVALTGSDTSSNVLFGSLQKITAEQIGLSSTLMASANSAGGVMGKMIDAQSIVVASTATEWYGHEVDILRYVFFHSLALAALVGVFVFLQAYIYPFTKLVSK